MPLAPVRCRGCTLLAGRRGSASRGTGWLVALSERVEWAREAMAAQPYWFQRIPLGDGTYSPGWSDPETEKLPYYGLPERLDGLRVLDVGCAEGYFTLECERRGAAQVMGIDSSPGSIDRFGIVKTVLGARSSAYLCNVYDLSPRAFGTFDLVLFFGVLYHLKHPWFALEKLLSVCSGDLLLQTLVTDEPQYRDHSLSWFHPFGLQSVSTGGQRDPTVFWVPTPECARNLVRAAGFVDVENVCDEPARPFVLKASAPVRAPGQPPDQDKAPWS